MSRPPKPAATAKKVAPPAVPHEFRHSGSSFGSAGYASSEDAGFLAPSDPPGVPRDDHSDYGSTVSSSTGKSPGPIFPAPTFTFPGQPPPGAVLTHKAAVYYHHQLSLQEDQGIDMTQVSLWALVVCLFTKVVAESGKGQSRIFERKCGVRVETQHCLAR
jgi:hypothetical protein